MKLVDTNVWLALSLSKHSFHDAAQVWLAVQTTAQDVAFCRASQQSFLRLLTTPAVMNQYGNPPLTNTTAWDLYEGIRRDSRITFAEEPAGIDAQWKALAARDTASPKLWMDAYLAAFAIAGGHQLVTIDRDFSQFPALDCFLIPST